ncbi:MAG TPA: glycosyltransferase family 2 protein [Rhizomicrobium sp.]|nr:glycosyltransferase family 2 protein [Rhizomicrobium sp.]
MNDSRPAIVGVIFVNWNGWQHTVAACRSLDQSTHHALKIIIVDNASADDSLVQLRAALPKAHIIANPINAGFAGACNIGIRHAVQQCCDYFFLLNNDALAEGDTVASLVQASKTQQDSALLGSVLVYISSGTYQFFGSRTGTVVRQPEFLTFEKDAALLSQDFIETDFIIGAAFFIPIRVWDRIGPFDERFFLNYEETDFCYRARNVGIPSFIVPTSVVRHHANASLGSYPAPMYAYFMTRNGLLFAEEHGSPAQHRPLFRLKTLYWDIRRSWKTTRRKDLTTWAILWAFWDYSWRRFGDCPAAIRRLDARYRRIPYRPSSGGKGKR